MPIPPGVCLGPYEVLAPIGAGGMGEVYRARDTRLDHAVAIKILPSHLAADGQFRDRFFYTASTGTCCPPAKPSVIRVGALDSTEAVTLFQTESSVAYGSGHLLFSRDGTLVAERFDPDTRQVKGDPFPVADQVNGEGSRYASFSLSESGVMVYARGTARATTRLTWFDRAGNTTGTVGEPASYAAIQK